MVYTNSLFATFLVAGFRGSIPNSFEPSLFCLNDDFLCVVFSDCKVSPSHGELESLESP